MDATLRHYKIPPELHRYAERNKIFEIFQNLLERIAVKRPEKPIEYLRELLVKQNVFDVPKVYILGPPVTDRKLVCAIITGYLQLVHLDIENLDKDSEIPLLEKLEERIEKPDCCKKGWVLEGFPRTRQEAFSIRKKGIFPTHIAVLEDPSLIAATIQSDFRLSTEEQQQEVAQYLTQVPLILDLHHRSYIKKFQIRADAKALSAEVLDFVRSEQHPPSAFFPRVLLIGPYGSGRRTVAKQLGKKYNLVVEDFHEVLSQAAMKDTPLKKVLHDILLTTEPVPDKILAEVAAQRLRENDCTRKGWILYNFPDTAKQAEYLAEFLEGFQLNRAIFLDVDLETCLFRTTPRRLDLTTGKVYHMEINPSPPIIPVSRLVQRPEDAAESVTADYELYQRNFKDLLRFFQQGLAKDVASRIDAKREKEEVVELVGTAILKSSKLKLPESEGDNLDTFQNN